MQSFFYFPVSMLLAVMGFICIFLIYKIIRNRHVFEEIREAIKLYEGGMILTKMPSKNFIASLREK